MKHDVFVSFSFSDREAAENLVNLLSSRYGISCWICTYDLNGGSLYKDLIPDAIDAAQAVVFVQSEHSIASREVPKEIGIAFDAEKTIIPFRLDETPLKGALRYDLYGLEYIDGTVPSFEARVAELAECILRVLGRGGAENTLPASNPVYELMPTPLGCSEIFYGRERDMQQLEDAFRDRNTVFLHGMGGIGKSELAKQYARNHRSEYTTVVFAPYGGSLAALLANDDVFKVKGLARRSRADGSPQSDEEYAAVKLNVLQENCDAHTLIIVDNFDVSSDPLLDTLASGAPYHLLLTSRLEPERGKYYVQQVTELDDEVLRDLVVEFANPNTTMVDREDAAFPELFALTNRHTLTLELIARYMEEKCIDEIGEMVDLLKKHEIALLESSENRQRAMAVRSLFRMTEMSRPEQDFLRWLALMPLDGIGQKLFREWCGPDVFSARTRLAGLGLIRMNPTEKKISLHPIVRQVVLSELKTTMENSGAFFDRVTASIYTSWNWPVGQKLAAAQFAKNVMDALGELNEENFTLYYTFGVLGNLVLSCDTMMPFWQKLYDYGLAVDGEDSLRAGLAAYRAGWISKNCDLQAARQWLEERSYPILRVNSEKVPKEYPHALTNIGTIYLKLHETDPQSVYLEKAEAFFGLALQEATLAYETALAKGDEAVAWNTHIKTAGAYMGKTKLAIRKKDYAAAEECIKKAAEILPPESQADLFGLDVLRGKICFETGLMKEAQQYYAQALEGFERLFPENDPQILDAHIALAQCLEKTGDPAGAGMHWEKAERIAEAILTEDHPLRKQIAENRIR